MKIISTWFPQADQAGYWQTEQDKLGHDKGLDIKVLPGGPKIQTIPQVASGQAEFGMGNADDLLVARMRGAPVKAIFVHLDYVPYTLVFHKEAPVQAPADLKGRTVALSLGFAYWEWIKKQYGVTGVREIPVSGDLTLFRNDPQMVQQGLSIYLPARMEEAGIPVRQLKVADLGYKPYNVLFTTDEMIAKHPEVVRATVAAVKEGWQRFLAHPAAIKPMLMSMNQQISPTVHDLAVEEISTLLTPKDRARVGCMSDARWSELAGQLRKVGFLSAGFDERQAYDASFVQECR